MPCLSIQFNPKVGPIVQVFVWKPGFVPPHGLLRRQRRLWL
jgi:hypothetical protein